MSFPFLLVAASVFAYGHPDMICNLESVMCFITSLCTGDVPSAWIPTRYKPDRKRASHQPEGQTTLHGRSRLSPNREIHVHMDISKSRRLVPATGVSRGCIPSIIILETLKSQPKVSTSNSMILGISHPSPLPHSARRIS